MGSSTIIIVLPWQMAAEVRHAPGISRSLLRFGPHRSAGSGPTPGGFLSRAANRDMRREEDHFNNFNRL